MWLNNFNSEDSEMQEREVNHYPSSWNASHNDHKPKPKNNKVVIWCVHLREICIDGLHYKAYNRNQKKETTVFQAWPAGHFLYCVAVCVSIKPYMPHATCHMLLKERERGREIETEREKQRDLKRCNHLFIKQIQNTCCWQVNKHFS